jgi:hypothetical protein
LCFPIIVADGEVVPKTRKSSGHFEIVATVSQQKVSSLRLRPSSPPSVHKLVRINGIVKRSLLDAKVIVPP